MSCTYNDLLASVDEATLIQLTDDDNEGYVDQTVIDSKIAEAYTVISLYTSGRYPGVSMQGIPALVPVVVDIATYLLYCRRPAGPPEHIENKYARWVKYLEKIASGDIDLLPEAETVSGGTSQVEAGDRVFTRSTMTGF